MLSLKYWKLAGDNYTKNVEFEAGSESYSETLMFPGESVVEYLRQNLTVSSMDQKTTF